MKRGTFNRNLEYDTNTVICQMADFLEFVKNAKDFSSVQIKYRDKVAYSSQISGKDMLKLLKFMESSLEMVDFLYDNSAHTAPRQDSSVLILIVNLMYFSLYSLMSDNKNTEHFTTLMDFENVFKTTFSSLGELELKTFYLHFVYQNLANCIAVGRHTKTSQFDPSQDVVKFSDEFLNARLKSDEYYLPSLRKILASIESSFLNYHSDTKIINIILEASPRENFVKRLWVNIQQVILKNRLQLVIDQLKRDTMPRDNLINYGKRRKVDFQKIEYTAYNPELFLTSTSNTVQQSETGNGIDSISQG